MDTSKTAVLSETDSVKNVEHSPTIDSETLFAKAIVEGDKDGVRGFLDTLRSAEMLTSMQLNIQNLHSICRGKFTT